MAALAGGSSVPGAFAAGGGRTIRPSLAPADPAILSKIKGWAVDALGGSPLLLPTPTTPGAAEEASTAPGGEAVEVYVRQMACRKPDCVPLETVIMLLGHGWHEKGEVLNAADAVTEAEVATVARELWATAAGRKQADTDAADADAADAADADADAAAAAASVPIVDTAQSVVTTFGSTQVRTVAPGPGAADGAAALKEGEDPVGGETLNVILPRDVTNYYEDSEEVYAVGTDGRKCTLMAGLEHLGGTLKELVLRSHLISRIEGISSLVHLTKLELYDNQVEALEQLEYLPQLTVLDMSYNSIRSMAPVAHCKQLEVIYLAQNKLRRIEGLEGLRRLRKLDVGGNRIRSLDGIRVAAPTPTPPPATDEGAASEHSEQKAEEPAGQGLDHGLTNVPLLEELWCGKNKIETIGGCLLGLGNLKRLDIQCNRLTRIDGGCLSDLSQLEELYLARNGVSGTVGADAFKGLGQLTTVDLGHNRLTSTEHLPGPDHCPLLEEAWLGGNRIADMDAAVAGLRANLPNLTCVYFEHNPLVESCVAEGHVDGEPAYRHRLLELLPTLTQIDADVIGRVRGRY